MIPRLDATVDLGLDRDRMQEPIFLGLHGPSDGGHAASGRWGGALDAWKAGKSHSGIRLGTGKDSSKKHTDRRITPSNNYTGIPWQGCG